MNINYNNLKSSQTKIKCNPLEIYEACSHIIQNSIDASQGQIPIEIYISTANHGEDFVDIHFCDNGSGIQDSIKDKIFDVMTTTKVTGANAGFGLAHAKETLEDHEGKIWVNTDHNFAYKTCISVQLPKLKQV